jgi:hypothetical protein
MSDQSSTPMKRRRSWGKIILIAFLVLFIAPVALRALLFSFEDRPRSFRDADWSSTGSLAQAKDFPEARVLVMAGQTGGWKGVVSLHSWIVIKDENEQRWNRYDVVGWGNPVRANGWAPDGRWYGSSPVVVAEIRGAEAKKIIPKIRAAIAEYRFANAGDYRMWPGPNSNSFVAAVLRAVPEITTALPPNAVGRDYREGFFAGRTDSGTGFEINLWGYAGLKLALVEGFEMNVLGLVAGLDVRDLGVKLPAFGTLALKSAPALADTPARR